jgi:hypothetical protein
MGRVNWQTLHENEWFKLAWPEDGFCLFCGVEVNDGSYWSGTRVIAICSRCVLDGKLGVLIGDAFNSIQAIERAVAQTRAEAFRALAIQHEVASRKHITARIIKEETSNA